MEFFDLHCDTLYAAVTKQTPLYQNNLAVSVRRGLCHKPWVQCFAVWIPDTLRGEEATRFFDKACDYLYEQAGQHSGELVICTTKEELVAAVQGRRCAALLTVEGGAVLNGKLETLDHLASRGVRMMTLTWNGSNELGDGVKVQRPKGLTAFGKQAVAKMGRLHMAVDISHASEPLFYDVASFYDGPLVASHSNAKAVCPHPRNLTNEQFEQIRRRGGLVGLTLERSFLATGGDVSCTSVLRHADHFLSLNGAETLALGTDFDGADMPDDLNAIEKMETLYETFLRHGYEEALVRAIFFGNAFRFFCRLGQKEADTRQPAQ